jgi:hypothetical protein
VTCYPPDRLTEETAYIAYHFHWTREDIWSMPHRERHQWVESISAINKKINAAATSAAPPPPAPSQPPPSPPRPRPTKEELARGGFDLVND